MTALRTELAATGHPAPEKSTISAGQRDAVRAEPHGRSQHYDICYAAVLFDHLSDRQAVALIRDCYGLLAAGGALILGSPTCGVPGGERALSWGCWIGGSLPGRTDFQRLFAQTPFGSESLLFEREPLGGDLLVSATRS